MTQSKRTRRAAGLTVAAVVIAATGASAQGGAFAAPVAAGSGTAGVLADAVTLAVDFTDRTPAKLSGGTVVPVTVSGGTVGATAKDFTALRVTAKVGDTAAKVTWVDSTHLKITVPAAAKAVPAAIRLLVNGVAGPVSSSTVAYLPTVSTVSPAQLAAASGGTVTINGAGFLGVDPEDPSAVKIGDRNADSFTVVSATKITAVAPAGADGTAEVTVTSAGGTSLVTATTTVKYRAPVVIDTSDEPVAKASGGPVVLTVTGVDLGATAAEFATQRVTVRVGARTVSATYVDRTHLKAVMPPIAAEKAEVLVVRDGIAGEPAQVTVVPVVTALSVRSDTVAGGAKVTVKLAGVDLAGATGFTFGANPATCTPQGTGASVTFQCVVPPSSEAGPMWVAFTSSSGMASRFTSAAAFAYTAN
jgi:hypothetical protein